MTAKIEPKICYICECVKQHEELFDELDADKEFPIWVCQSCGTERE